MDKNNRHNLASIVSQEIVGLLLSHAYVVVKSAGVRFRVNKLDGTTHVPEFNDNVTTINVDVLDGIVVKSWVN